MASNNLNEQILWIIKIISKKIFSDEDRNFIAELVSEEARKSIEFYSFILHDILESKRYINVLIEGSQSALNNLLLVIKHNIPYEISYTKYNS